MSPNSGKILTFPPKRRPRGEYDRFPNGSPMWHELDNIWLNDLAEGLKEGLARRKRRAVLAIADDAGGGP